MSKAMAPVKRMTELVGSNRMELLLFDLGSRQKFGINVFKLREIIHCPGLTQMPLPHPSVRGAAHLRGATVTVIDMAQAISLPPLPMSPPPQMLVTEYNRQVQGFLVNKVERIVNVNWDDIKAPPKGLGHANYLTAVTRVDQQLIQIIDVEKVIGEVTGVALSELEQFPEDSVPGNVKPILVVDDSMMARKQIVRVLEQMEIPYETATNGREALDRLTQVDDAGQMGAGHFSFVLSDVEMPEMDGYTLTRRIKEDARLSDLYVCLHTSLSGVFNKAMVEKVRADRLLTKFDAGELAHELVTILRMLDQNHQDTE